ncbi:MAG: hypothetical protein ACLR2G_04980 [Phascolarctobacterium faecium]
MSRYLYGSLSAADILDVELTQALAASGQRTMTVAPEAGSVKMRNIINNRGITEEHVLMP